jgi:hypothetical protein
MFDEDARHGEVGVYTAGNPHPMFGKDPNILNELGHTKYPMWVDHPNEKRVDTIVTHLRNNEQKLTEIQTKFPTRVLVQNEDEHQELLGKAKDEPKTESEPKLKNPVKAKEWANS